MKLNQKIKNILKPYKKFNYCLMTLGNIFRSDDAIGIYIANNIKYSSKNFLLINAEYSPENYIDFIIDFNPKKFVIIDAASFNGKIGEIKILNQDLIPDFSLSTHSISPKIITELIKTETKCKTYFVGIQVYSVDYGYNIHNDVIKSANLIINYINSFIKS